MLVDRCICVKQLGKEATTTAAAAATATATRTSMGRGWTTGILAAGSLAAAAQAAVTVTEPSRGLQVIAGR